MAKNKNFKHPSIEVVKRLSTLNITKEDFLKKTGINKEYFERFIEMRAGCTVDMSFKLSRFFKTTIDYWYQLQKNYDINN